MYMFKIKIKMFHWLVDPTSLANVQTKIPPVAERKTRTIIRSKGGKYSITDFSEVKEEEVKWSIGVGVVITWYNLYMWIWCEDFSRLFNIILQHVRVLQLLISFLKKNLIPFFTNVWIWIRQIVIESEDPMTY